MIFKRCSVIRKNAKRITTGLLSFVLLCLLLPTAVPTVEASDWTKECLNKLVSWGVMRGDISGKLHPERNITRAEFVTMTNRAYGYNTEGANPFADVDMYTWYADDIGIAYKAGYFAGTSKNTASPLRSLTRQEAAILIGRNMMLQESVGEVMRFTDGRDISTWSRGMVQAVAGAGVIGGYPDGSFRPNRPVTRGEVACMLARAIGTPVQTPGEHTLGHVYGNVTVNTSGVTLKNTVIAGDLYLSGGIGLGNILLENVTVLGRIVAGGAGESDKGDNSIILRNVTAKEMVVDTLSNQFVTVRVEGDTDIESTRVRTPSYIEDVTRSSLGLKYIALDGEPGIPLQLAGNIKEVVNFTPNSQLTIAQGTAAKVTSDEKAVGSILTIKNGANVKELNLDVGITVTGGGDIDHLNVNAPGSTVAILPDTIVIRPGITASIAGEIMDTVTAAESSADPKLLAGYPTARNVAPTNAEAVFSTNKKGVVYWAITALTDGSVNAEDLLSPPAYSSKILKSGRLPVTSSKTEVFAKISGLVSDGSYYISALLVDARDQRSPVKVAAFTTPDNSVPQFASGYPYMSKITNYSGQVTVMPTKRCQLFWAVLPKGSAAPTAKDFKAGSISGNLGYGNMDVEKNTTSVFTANSQNLKELATYDLYLCLIDADGGKDSGVKKLTFTTVDGTPPVFLNEPTVTSIKTTSVDLLSSLNEAGNIYWAVVKAGEEYPKPLAGQTTKPALNSDTAKLQVANGMNALKAGKVSASANKDVTINASGLLSQTAYDLYYLAQDKAGNYSDTVKMITIHTLDTDAPTVTQEFTKTADAYGKEPLPGTDIKIIFSEGVQHKEGQIFLDLYNTSKDTAKTDTERKQAKQALYELMLQDFTLYDASSVPPYAPVEEGTASQHPAGHWIDYHEVEVSMEDGKTVFLFKNGTALNLNSGGTYYFQISNIADTSNNKNLIKPNPQKLPQFTTVFARVNLESRGIVGGGPLQDDGNEVRVDLNFQMHPISTNSVDESICYDVFFWLLSDSPITFDLYARVKNQAGQYATESDAMFQQANLSADGNGWVRVKQNMEILPENEPVGTSVRRQITADGLSPQLKKLQDSCTYEYAISLVAVDGLTDPTTWSQRVSVGITVPAGYERNVTNLSRQITTKQWKEALAQGLGNGVMAINDPADFKIIRQYNDTQAPGFDNSYPTFDAGDAFVNMQLQLNRPGTVYYAIAPVQKVGSGMKFNPVLPTKNLNGSDVLPTDNVPPKDGSGIDQCPQLSAPTKLAIYKNQFNTSRVKHGTLPVGIAAADVRIDGLEAETIYYAYFVLKGESQTLSEVYCFQFTTQKVSKPAITLINSSPEVYFQASTDADLNYALIPYKDIWGTLKVPFSGYATVDFDESKIPKSAWEQDGNSSNFSILDALLTAGTTGFPTHSVFDEFALPLSSTTTIRKDVAEYIRGNTAQGGTLPIAMGEIKGMQANAQQVVNFSKNPNVKSGVQYYCLAVAHNTQGTEDAFRGIKNIQKPDGIPPEFLEVKTEVTSYKNLSTNNISPVPPADLATNPSMYAYSGTVTISFDKPIYFISSTSIDPLAVPVLLDFSGTQQDVDGEKVYFHNHADATFTYKTSKTTTAATDTIVLKFTDVRNQGNLTMLSDGQICSIGNAPTSKKLTLTFDPTMTTADQKPGVIVPLPQPAPGFRASWR